MPRQFNEKKCASLSTARSSPTRIAAPHAAKDAESLEVDRHILPTTTDWSLQ
jgi:hypothetical protein